MLKQHIFLFRFILLWTKQLIPVGPMSTAELHIPCLSPNLSVQTVGQETALIPWSLWTSVQHHCCFFNDSTYRQGRFAFGFTVRTSCRTLTWEKQWSGSFRKNKRALICAVLVLLNWCGEHRVVCRQLVPELVELEEGHMTDTSRQSVKIYNKSEQGRGW